MFAVTTVEKVWLAEQITCSTAEGSEMYVDAHGMLPFVALDFKRNWNI